MRGQSAAHNNTQARANHAATRAGGNQARTNHAQVAGGTAQTPTNHAQVAGGTAQARTNRANALVANNSQVGNRHAQALGSATRSIASPASTTPTRTSVLGTTSPSATSPSTTAGATATGTAATPSISPNSYTYGLGAGARSYQAYGYGRGYRNRSYGGRYGYGRSQGNNRAIVARLRSVHASLARIDHDYQGHRVRAMHAISMAIRQLSHRSMVYSNTGFSSRMNNGQAMGMRQGGLGGVGARVQAAGARVSRCPRPNPTPA